MELMNVTVQDQNQIGRSLNNGLQLPYTLRNPLYHWTHLELQRYFGIKISFHPHLQGRFMIPNES
jgi:hypothetical protein